MDLIALAMLLTLYFMLTLFALWWATFHLRRSCEQKLESNRMSLLREIEVQLRTQASRPEDRRRKP